jgi:methylphosphotriester-DNA--protein-cysteine methyltransferase
MKTSTSPQHTALITEACRIIEQAERAPSLQQLSDRVGMSSFHFHRLFNRSRALPSNSTRWHSANNVCVQRCMAAAISPMRFLMLGMRATVASMKSA